MAETPRAKHVRIAERLSGAEGGTIAADEVRDWVNERANATLARDLLIHVTKQRPSWVHRIAEVEHCEETLVWDAACWALATRHNLLECRLVSITDSVLAADRQPSDQVELRNGRWVEEQPGHLRETRTLMKKATKALERADQALLELDQHFNAREIIDHHLQHSELGECRYWIGEIRQTLQDVEPDGGGKSLVVPGWEVWAASLAAQLWHASGGTVSVWRKRESEGVSRFQQFALAWLRLLGATEPQGAIRAMYDAAEQEPGARTPGG